MVACDGMWPNKRDRKEVEVRGSNVSGIKGELAWLCVTVNQKGNHHAGVQLGRGTYRLASLVEPCARIIESHEPQSRRQGGYGYMCV